MDQPNNSENQLNVFPTFIFTNTGGNVIFSDQKFINILGEKSANILLAEPIRSILHIDSQAENQLIEVVKQKSIVEKMTVSYSTSGGKTINTDSTIIAAMDENGNFLGLDLVLKNSSKPRDNETKLLTHADVIKAYVEMEMNSRDPLQPRTFTQSYIAAQFNVLQIMLARIGGVASRLAFEKLTNNTIRSMGLPIIMKDGNLNFLKKDFDVKVYRSLLQTSTEYAVNVVGKNTVKREMLLVDKFIGPGTLELISQMDLRIFTAE